MLDDFASDHGPRRPASDPEPWKSPGPAAVDSPELIQKARDAYAAADFEAFVAVCRAGLDASKLTVPNVLGRTLAAPFGKLPIVEAAIQDGRPDWIRMAMARGARADQGSLDPWLRSVRGGWTDVVAAAIEGDLSLLLRTLHYRGAKGEAVSALGYALSGGPLELVDPLLARLEAVHAGGLRDQLRFGIPPAELCVERAIKAGSSYLAQPAVAADTERSAFANHALHKAQAALRRIQGIPERPAGYLDEDFDPSTQSWTLKPEAAEKPPTAARAQPAGAALAPASEASGGSLDEDARKISALESEVAALRARLGSRSASLPSSQPERPIPSLPDSLKARRMNAERRPEPMPGSAPPKRRG